MFSCDTTFVVVAVAAAGGDQFRLLSFSLSSSRRLIARSPNKGFDRSQLTLDVTRARDVLLDFSKATRSRTFEQRRQLFSG